MNSLRSSRFAFAALAAVAITGCTTTTETTPGYVPTPTQSGSAVPVAQGLSAVQSAATTAGAAVTIPATGAGGFTASATLPDASAAVTVADTLTSAAPNGVTMYGAARAPLGTRATRDVPAMATTIDYLTISANGPVSFVGAATFTFTLPSVPSGYAFYLAEELGGNFSSFAGPATVSGTTLTFTAADTAIALTAQVTQSFELYALPAGAAPPSAAVTVNPAGLTFATAASAPQTFAAAEGSDSGTFTAFSTAVGVATVTASSSGTFTVTPVGAGTAIIEITGPNGNQALEAVSVTGVPVTVSGHARAIR